MKRLLSSITSIITVAIIAVSNSIFAFAEDNVQLSVDDAVTASNWSQSLKTEYKAFDSSRMTENSEIIVTYTCNNINKNSGTKYPVELVFQSWEFPDTPMADAGGNVWAKVAPAAYSDTEATYKYSDIVKAYGTDNFDLVSAICINATDRAEIICTGVTITNCKDKGTHIIPKTEKKLDDKNKSPIVLIIGITTGVILAVVVTIFILNKKSSKAFDINSGKFVSKKKAK